MLLLLWLLSSAAWGAVSVSNTGWQACGWGGGGFYWSCAFDPRGNGAIYLGGDVAGVYKSDDHGLHWRFINNGLAAYGVYSLAVDPTNPEVVYAATDKGLCRSADGGSQWALLPRTGPRDLRLTGEKGKSIRSIAVDPVDGRVVYVASPAGKVFRSTDAGQTWKAVYEAPEGGIYSVTVGVKTPSLVLAATEKSGLVLSADSGRTWSPLKTPGKASSAAVASSDSNVIYGSFFKDGIWKSLDRGRTWSRVSTRSDVSFTEVAISPSDSNDVYAIGVKGDWGAYVGRSHDGGRTWAESATLSVDADSGDPTLPQDARGNAPISAPTNIAINPKNPQELYVSGNWRPALSQDGGRTWTERVRGADISVVTDIRFREGKTWVACMDEGVLASDDDGANWRQVWPLKYDAGFSGHAWRLGFARANGVDRIVSTLSPWNGPPNLVAVSDDGGTTFRAARAGLPAEVPVANTMWGRSYPRGLAVDPTNPAIVYLGMDGDPAGGKQGGGLFKSTDGGRTWEQPSRQPGSRRIFYGLAVDPADSRRIYWAGCGERGGLYRSEDSGSSWQLVFAQETWPFNVLVTAEGVVYCPGANLWRSADHGKTWSQLTHFDKGGAIVGLEAHPRDPRTIWLSLVSWGGDTQNVGVFRTRDAGATWADITGDLPCRGPLVLRFNPATNDLWAGGPGLFRLKE